MGTYSDSKITIARKAHKCAACLSEIAKGTEQLAYKPGLRTTTYVHLSCALGQFRKSDGSRWCCKALEDRSAVQPTGNDQP